MATIRYDDYGHSSEPVVIQVDKTTHDVLFENEDERRVTVAIRPKALQADGYPNAGEDVPDA